MTTKFERMGRKNKRFIDHAIKKIRPSPKKKTPAKTAKKKSKGTKFIGV